MPLPPRPPHGDHQRTCHDDAVRDPFAWLADPQAPAVREHLAAENAYAEAMTTHLQPLREAIFAEIRDRTQESDLSVPVSYRGWWYYARTERGRQYPWYCRVRGEPGRSRPALVPDQSVPGEQVLLDGNAEVGPDGYLAVGALEVSPDGQRVAVAIDDRGDERFAVSIRDAATGAVLDEALTEVGYGIAWSGDGRYVFTTRVDDTWRPHEVWRHEVGRPAGEDVRVLAEPDERFWLGITPSRDDRFLVIAAASKDSAQTHLLDLHDPTGTPRCVAPRREQVQYEVEPAGEVLLITHNADRPDFSVSWAPLDATGPHQWCPWLEPAADERVVAVDAFADHVVVALRSGGGTAVRIVARTDGGAGRGQVWDVPVDEPLYTIGLADNLEWQADRLLVALESFVTPPTIAEYDLATRGLAVIKTQPVLGGYDPACYVQRREWVSAPDGTRVPCSIVHRRDVRLDGSAPGYLCAYGAYEISLDPWFSVARLSLLDRGVVFAVAHARGGGELGRSWYEDGRLAAKPNTFTDIAACAEHLLAAGIVAPERLGLYGASAGGLSVGAVANLVPHRLRVVHADVPFVDALTSMLDPDLPLTVTEWEEWGDPVHDPAAYALMKGYTPYENVAAVQYPAVLATTSLNDTRVRYVEPAKWVARLRETVTQDQAQRPILLRTELVAGHGGRSGRYDAWRDYAFEAAFVLDQLGCD